MATGTRQSNGSQRVDYYYAGKRHTWYLGKITTAERREVEVNIERLVTAKEAGLVPDSRTQLWVTSLADKECQKLADRGLVEPRAIVATIGELCSEHIERKQQEGKSPGTIKNLERTASQLLRFFSKDYEARRVTTADAERFAGWLRSDARLIGRNHRPGDEGHTLAGSTVFFFVRRAREFFNTAKRRGWVESNPFVGLGVTDSRDVSRDRYISWDEWKQAADGMATAEWRLCLAMARVVGMRVPSELGPLCWQHVQRDTGLIVLHRPKTARLRPVSEVPIFDELVPYLNDAYDTAAEGEEYVFPTIRLISGQACTSRLEKAYRAAGMLSPAKPWQNARASASRDLLAICGLDTENEVLGHTAETTLSHYRRSSQFREVQKGSALCLPNYETKHHEIHNAQSVRMSPPRTALHGNAGKTVRMGSLEFAKVSPSGLVSRRK